MMPHLNSATPVGSSTRALHVTVDRRQAKPITLLDAAKCILFARREADLGPLERIEGHLARLNECIRRTDIELTDLREILSAEGKV